MLSLLASITDAILFATHPQMERTVSLELNNIKTMLEGLILAVASSLMFAMRHVVGHQLKEQQ